MQTAVTMLRPFPEQKALIYFGSGLRLNGTDNTAQLRATTNAAIRANVTIHPVDARGLVATPPLGDATQRSPGGQAMFTGATAGAMIANFQRSQDALFSLAKDTGGTATFDNNDLSRRHQARRAVGDQLLHARLLQHPHRGRRQVPARAGVADRGPRCRDHLPAGLLRRQDVREAVGRGARAPAGRSADAREPDHRHPDRDGGELLPVESRRILRAGGGEDSRQRAGAGAPPRRAADAHRLHRRGEGRLRRHHPERPRQAGHQAERRRRPPSWRRGRSSTRPASRCCRGST